MRIASRIVPVLGVLALAACSPAGPVTKTFVGAAAITIPAGAPGTTSGPADPYPSTVTVTNMPGTITKVTVTLSQLSHTFPDDVGVLLVGPGGDTVELMSDVGGSIDVASVTLTFDQAAADPLPDAGPLVSGTFRPTISGAGETYDAPAPAGPYGGGLDVFVGTVANGDWRLFVEDDAGIDVGAFTGGWSLTITGN